MRWLWSLFCLAMIVVLPGSRPALGHSEPTERPRPSDFVTVEILGPRHGEIIRVPSTNVRVRVSRPIIGMSDYRLYVALDGQQIGRSGQPANKPIHLTGDETEIAIPVSLARQGVHQVEAYSVDYVPFSNYTRVQFGYNKIPPPPGNGG